MNEHSVKRAEHWYSACDEHLKVMESDGEKHGLDVVHCKDTDGFSCGFPGCKKKAKWEVYFMKKYYDLSKAVPYEKAI